MGQYNNQFVLLPENLGMSMTTEGFTSGILEPNKGLHCVSYYAHTLGVTKPGKLKAHLSDAKTGAIILDTVHIAEIDSNEQLFYFEVEEQPKSFKVCFSPGRV